MQALRISLVQGATRWHDAVANRGYYGALVACAARAAATSSCCPETFLVGFTNETLGNAETMDGAGLHWLRDLAQEVGAVDHRQRGDARRRSLRQPPDLDATGRQPCVHYDKRHLFRMAKEHERYAGGDERLIVELNGWRICPQVCYDLRFPVWLRNRYDRAAEPLRLRPDSVRRQLAERTSARVAHAAARARDRESELLRRRQSRRRRRQRSSLRRRQRRAGLPRRSRWSSSVRRSRRSR